MALMKDLGPQFSHMDIHGNGTAAHRANAGDKGRSSTATGESSYEADQDNAYLSELLSYSLDRLNKEPALLEEDQDCIRRQMQECAVSHHRAFVEAAQHMAHVRDQVATVNNHLKGMLTALPELQAACASFTDEAEAVQSKLDMHKQLQANHPQLLELLEVPQLMDTCVRNANYDEALDLEAFVAKMAFLHPELAVVAGLHAEVKAIAQSMLKQLLTRLSGSIQLPECLRVIGFLRRLSAFTEPELRLKFLQCREQWLVEMVSDLDTQNPYDYLKRLTDIHRLHLFDVVMQYKAIFSEDSPPPGDSSTSEAAILTSWAQHRVGLYLESLHAHLPLIKEGGSLSSVLEHSMYCGMSLGRVGLDFRGLLPPVFEKCVAALFSTALSNALEAFHMSLERHKWVPMPNIPYAPKRQLSSNGEKKEDTKEAGAEALEDLSPPHVLMEHLPLAVFVNGILQAFNELRHCTPLALRTPVGQSLQDAIRAVASALAHYHATRALSESESRLFESACRALADVVAPYVAACYGRFYAGCAGAINAAEATAPLKDIIEASKAREAEAVAAAGASAAAAVAPAKVKKTKMVKVEKGAKTTVVPPPAAKKAPAQPTEEVLVKESNS
mmetsp:Transcript_14649/g.36788  ORF Transcript_14649/g.36788 Transcript_14649/m.36788 type:complete len:614 (-) Transcript_14649:93-1934(-)